MAYHVQNTQELFKVTCIDVTQKIPIYYLEVLAGEEVRGGFSREKLVKTSLFLRIFKSMFYVLGHTDERGNIWSTGEVILPNSILG